VRVDGARLHAPIHRQHGRGRQRLEPQVIDYCEQYRHAVEQRNTARLLKMAHPSYFEDGGNVDASDDMNYDDLKKYLESQFNQTTAIRYEIHYRQVSEGRKNTVLVDYTYSASYKVPTSHGTCGADASRTTGCT